MTIRAIRQRLVLLVIGGGLVLSVPTLAQTVGQPEAREVARMAGCTPAAIEVERQTPGVLPETVYRVTCLAAQADAEARILRINCRFKLCQLIR